LALWSTDLKLEGPSTVSLCRTNIPTVEPMAYFVCSRGINNPPCENGYGGTPVPDGISSSGCSTLGLLQIGGAQNTIRNISANAPFPTADVFEGAGQSTTILAEVSFTIPSTADPGL